MTVAQLAAQLASLNSAISAAQSGLRYWSSQVAIASQNAQTYAQEIASLQAQIAARQASVGGTGHLQ